MAELNQKTVVLEVTFAKRQPAQPILNRLMEAGLSSAAVLRGRVTALDAWFRLELRGTIPVVDAAVRRHRSGSILPIPGLVEARMSLPPTPNPLPSRRGAASPSADPPPLSVEAT